MRAFTYVVSVMCIHFIGPVSSTYQHYPYPPQLSYTGTYYQYPRSYPVTTYQQPAASSYYSNHTTLTQPAGISQGHSVGSQGHSEVSQGHDPRESCYEYPSYTRYNFSSAPYDYPQNEINTELTVRTDILTLLYKEGVKATSPYDEKDTLFHPQSKDYQSSVGDGVKKGRDGSGCDGYKLLLQKFDSYGGQCWVIQPRHQDITYLLCGAAKCKGSGGNNNFSACAVEENVKSVWAWCATLPAGRRITKIYLPLTTSCKCRVFNC